MQQRSFFRTSLFSCSNFSLRMIISALDSSRSFLSSSFSVWTRKIQRKRFRRLKETNFYRRSTFSCLTGTFFPFGFSVRWWQKDFAEEFSVADLFRRDFHFRPEEKLENSIFRREFRVRTLFSTFSLFELKIFTVDSSASFSFCRFLYAVTMSVEENRFFFLIYPEVRFAFNEPASRCSKRVIRACCVSIVFVSSLFDDIHIWNKREYVFICLQKLLNVQQSSCWFPPDFDNERSNRSDKSREKQKKIPVERRDFLKEIFDLRSPEWKRDVSTVELWPWSVLKDVSVHFGKLHRCSKLPEKIWEKREKRFTENKFFRLKFYHREIGWSSSLT